MPIALCAKGFRSTRSVTHLRTNHIAELITLFESYRKSGRIDRGVHVWGPSDEEHRALWWLDA